MKKETDFLAVISDKKAERVMKARERVKELSEIFTGRPPELEESFYIKRLKGIDAAYKYLAKKMDYQKEQQSANMALKIAFWFFIGMLFGAIVTNMPAIRGAFKL
jgi:hypothetical protein